MSNSRSLLEMANLVRGVSYKRDEARQTPGPDLVPILRANNIQSGHLVFTDLVYVPLARVSEEQRLRRDDILFAMSSGSRDVVGKAALVTSDWNGGFGAFCGVLRAKEGTNAKWLAHFLQSPPYREAIDSIATGTNINNLSKSTLSGVQVPEMAESTQAEIAQVLDAMSKHKTGGVSHLRAARRAIERFRQSVLAAACSGRLTADWREQYKGESGRDLLERLATPKKSSARREWKAFERNSEPLEAPEPWAVASFGTVTINHDGRRVPVKAAERKQRQGPFPYYGASGVIDHVDDFLFDGDFLLVSEDGANLLARVTPIAFRAHGQFWVNNHAHVVAAKLGVLDSYLEIAINGRDIQGYVTGSAQPKLTQAALNALAVALPSSAEQEEIVRRVDRLLGLAESFQRRIDVASKLLSRSSQSVLAKAFRGELNVANWTAPMRKAVAPTDGESRGQGRK